MRTMMVMLIVCVGCGESEPAPPEWCDDDYAEPTNAVTVSGRVVDWVTDEPVAGAEVAVRTAWDTPGDFPDECPPTTRLVTDEEGRFGPQRIDLDTVSSQPIVIFMVTGEGLAPTASDQRITCEAGECGNLGHTIAAIPAALAGAWRADLAAGGMADAETRGLVLLEYRETDGTPAAGVAPFVSVDPPVDLVPGVDMRFLSDRMTLAGPDVTATQSTGVAIFGRPADSESIGGRRGEPELWFPIGVLFSDGWFFYEDRSRTP